MVPNTDAVRPSLGSWRPPLSPTYGGASDPPTASQTSSVDGGDGEQLDTVLQAPILVSNLSVRPLLSLRC